MQTLQRNLDIRRLQVESVSNENAQLKDEIATLKVKMNEDREQIKSLRRQIIE